MLSPIPFSKPYLTENELTYLRTALASGHWQGDGPFSRKCCDWLRHRTGAEIFLTPSGTAALELAFMSLGLRPGDEVILPSFTFVSSANALVHMGLVPVFIDIRGDTLNLDERLIEQALTERTKAILVVHYAGISASMATILQIAQNRNLFLIEDACQGVNAYYQNQALL